MTCQKCTQGGVEIYAETFRSRMESKRLDMWMSQQGASELAGISKNLWYQYESGNRLPSFKNLIKISKCLNVSIDWLIGRR